VRSAADEVKAKKRARPAGKRAKAKRATAKR